MKNSCLFAIIGLSVSLLFASCKECKEGNGRIISENRTTTDMWFDEVESNISCDVYVYKSATFKVIVEGDDNLIPYYTAKVNNGRLQLNINTDKCIKDEDNIKIHVYAPAIAKIVQNSSGYLDCDSIYNNSLETVLTGSGTIRVRKSEVQLLIAKISGSGIIELSGYARSANYSISGSGIIKAYKMEADDCDVTITGSGNAYTFFYDQLNVDIPGSGSVFFRGDDRRVFVRITGTGKVIDDN